MKSVKPQRFNNFDYLRLLLALIGVAAFHAWNATGPKFLGLTIAVPAFLCISGFVIPPSLETSQGAVHFFWKRILRVMPAFIASLLAVWLIWGFASVGPTLRSWYTLGLVRDRAQNGVLWSLGCEEVIYIAFVVAYALGAYKRPVWLWAMLAVSMTAQIWALPHLTTFAIAPATLPSAFITGNLLYVYRERLKTTEWIPVLAAAALLALTAVRPADLRLQFLHLSLLNAALVWVCFAGPQIKWKMPLDISYGCYIYHLIVLDLLFKHGVRDRAGLILWTVLGAVCVSIVSAILIEQPALNYKNSPPSLHFWKARRAKIAEAAA